VVSGLLVSRFWFLVSGLGLREPASSSPRPKTKNQKPETRNKKAETEAKGGWKQ
jgi:hypothetical protein